MAETQPGGAPATSELSSTGRVRPWLLVFIAALVLYAATASRGPQWQDPGFFILRVVTQQTSNPLGLALSHPLHHWLGRLAVWPGLIEASYAVTLVSALAAAVAVANVFGCVRTLTRNALAAILAAASLGLANTFWQMSTRAECYTVSAALLSGELWCLAAYARSRRAGFLCGALLLNGLGWSNHNLALLTLPVLGVVLIHELWRRRIHLTVAAAAVALWLVGSLLYTGMVVSQWMSSGDLPGTIRSALFGHAFGDEVLSPALPLRLIALSLAFVVFNFPNLLLPAAVHGLARSARIGVPVLAKRALLAGLAIHALFVLRYNVPDQYMFFTPVYVILSVFGGVGFAIAIDRWRPRVRTAVLAVSAALLLLTPATYAVAAAVARHCEALRSVARHKPYRDDYTYVLIPWSVAERSAERMSSEAVSLAGPDGLIVVEDQMARFAIQYQARILDGAGPQIVTGKIVKPLQQAADESRPVVLVPLHRDQPRTELPRGAWRRVGDLYVLDIDQGH